MTELLYHKQTQLEQLASERHVQQMTYERSLSAVRAEADRQKRYARSSCVDFIEGSDVVWTCTSQAATS